MIVDGVAMWEVFQTRQWRSPAAVEEINSFNGHAWTPTLTSFVRRPNVRKPKLITQPMLPNLLFVLNSEALPTGMLERRKTRYYALKYNFCPMLVPDSSLNPLRSLEVSQNHKKSEPIDCDGKSLASGDEVTVVSGPFSTQKATINSWDGSHFDVVINGFGARFRAAPFLLRKFER